MLGITLDSDNHPRSVNAVSVNKGIQFRFQGQAGRDYRVQLETSEISDYDYYSYVFTADGNWQDVVVYFPGFGNGEAELSRGLASPAFNGDSVTNVMIRPEFNGIPCDFCVDDLSFDVPSAGISPTVTPSHSHTLEVSSTPTGGSNSTVTVTPTGSAVLSETMMPTSTASLTQTLTMSQTQTTTSSSTQTASMTLTEIVDRSHKPEIQRHFSVPSPVWGNHLKLALELKGYAQRARLRLYSSGYIRVFEKSYDIQTANDWVYLQADLSNLASGYYHYQIQLENDFVGAIPLKQNGHILVLK